MPSLSLGCSCAERLIAIATGNAAKCRVEHGQLVVHLSHVPIHVFGWHVGVQVELESVACDPRTLVLRYRVHHVAHVPGWLIGGIVGWLAGRLVRHPLVGIHGNHIHIHLDRLRLGPKVLTEAARVTGFRAPADGAACSLTFVIKE
jgi:hypothetical protein